jgi:hypothetical protein
MRQDAGMNESSAGFTAALSSVITVYLLVAGRATSSDAPSPAEHAVGNGLLVLAGAVAIVAFVTTCVYADARNKRLGGP